jgi:hypothetical protein
MGSGSPKGEKLSSASGVVLYGLHFIFDAFGATRPVRLGIVVGLSLALDTPARVLFAKYAVALPSGFTLEYSLFGFSFCLLFLPLLFRPTIPEPLAERITAIETISKAGGLLRSEKRLLYLDLLEVVVKSDKVIPRLDLTKIRETHEAKIKTRVK